MRTYVRAVVAGLLLGVLAAVFPVRLAVFGSLELVLPVHERVHMAGGNSHYWDVLELKAKLETMGWAVAFVKLPDGWYGVTCPEQRAMGPCSLAEVDRAILVNEALFWNDRFETLAHEAGHTLQPEMLTKGQEENFAESVAALVTGRYREPAHYAARYRADILTLFVFQAEIYEAVRRLTP